MDDSKYSLFLILALLTAGVFAFSACIIWLREFEKIGILEADESSDSFTAGMSQHDPLCLFRSVRPEPSAERCSAQGQPQKRNAAEWQRQEAGSWLLGQKSTLPPKHCVWLHTKHTHICMHACQDKATVTQRNKYMNTHTHTHKILLHLKISLQSSFSEQKKAMHICIE